MDILNSGDLILFSSVTPCACCVSFFTKSKINHIGICIRGNDIFEEKNDKTYILQSSFEFIKKGRGFLLGLGVGLYELEDVLPYYPKIYSRKLYSSAKPEFFKNFFEKVRNAPYDFSAKTWLDFAGIKLPANKDKDYTCSALVGYMVSELNLYKANWDRLEPCLFYNLRVDWLNQIKTIK